MRPVSVVQPDRLTVESIRGAAASMALVYTNAGVGTPYDFTGMVTQLQLWTGDPDNPEEPFTEVPTEVDEATGTVYPTWTAAESLAVPLGRYGFRLRVYYLGEWVDQLQRGQWNHVEI